MQPQKVHNVNGKLVCVIPKENTVEIKDKSSITTITFNSDGTCKIDSHSLTKNKT